MQTFRKIIFWLHLIAGIIAGLVVLIMSVTGVALTYEKQIARWADGFEVSAPATGAAQLGPAALLSRGYEREKKIPSAVQIFSDPTVPASISFGRESYSVDPWTGERFGEGAVGVRKFFRSMIVWHRWLGQEGDGQAAGKAISGACNLAFVFILLTGPYLWWPKKWTWQHLRPIVLLRGGPNSRARDFNWHNVIGVWLAIPLILVAATAVFFSYSWPTNLLYAMTGEEREQRGRGPGGVGGERKEQLKVDYAGLDALFSKAASVAPGWASISVRPAADPHSPVTFGITRGGGFRPDQRSTVVVDRKTGDVVRHETHADNKNARNARTWIRFLHTGEAGGFVGQTLAGLASLAACVLVYTGWMLSWRRFRAWLAGRW